jgi:hypothetical protein
MTTIRITGQIDSAHRLTAQVPDGVPAGAVEVLMLPPAEADDEAWLAGVAREWRDELGDVRKDIYSITDGRPRRMQVAIPCLLKV